MEDKDGEMAESSSQIDRRHYLSRRSLEDQKEHPSHQLMDNHSNKRLKVSSLMNFSNFICRQSRKGKSNDNKDLMTCNELTFDNDFKGTSLRKWLKHKNSIEVNKTERMEIYKQVVQVVDMAHSQGNTLQDLWLSNFVLLPSNEIIYFDSSMINIAQNRIQSGTESYFVTLELEKNWYACPDRRESLSANIFSLGILLFELLSTFASLEMHCAAISDLHNRILPPSFISQNPQESAFCLWLLHPHPSSRPTTREILQSELLNGTKESYSKTIDKSEEDSELDILLEFLVSLKEQKEKHALELYENIRLLETDLKSFHNKNVYYDSNRLETRITKTDIRELESAYFSKRSNLEVSNTVDRNDPNLLGSNHETERCSNGVDFLDNICKFVRYSKFEECGNLKIGNLLNSTNVICSLSFDRDDKYIAVAGVSKKIKIFEFDFLLKLNDCVDVNYPAVELVNDSKLSCVCWNKYLKNYLSSADYDGVVQVWDAFSGQSLSHHIEHQKRAWCVDFSHVDPTQFASGSDDCSVKLWSLNNKNSTCTIRNAANVCCVQFSSRSSHLLAFGSADYKIQCYDLRHTRIPWCTLAGHQKAVSYVKFLDSDSIISASTDNTLKLWDLKKTSLEGISNDACCMTYKGHVNQKNFVGLSVHDGYIACGSESNEVFSYHKSFSMPIASYKFGMGDSVSSDENAAQFVSSVCWREKSNMIVAANSDGNIKVLKML